MAMKQVQIDVVSDVICPWCWVGKRHLEAARRQAGEAYDVDVRWHPFLLRPNTPLQGVAKAPNTPSNPRVGPRLAQAGAAVGIQFTGKTDRTPNTVLAHRALGFAGDTAGSKAQNELQEALFRGYFSDGVFIGDLEAIMQLAQEVSGLDTAALKGYLSSSDGEAEVVSEARANASKGVSGVPSFFFNGAFAFSGAQPQATFLAALENAPRLK